MTRVLPDRPRALRWAYLFQTLRRALFSVFALLLSGWIFAAGPGTAVMGLLRESSAVAADREVPLLGARVAPSASIVGVIQVFYVFATTVENGIEREEYLGPFFVLHDAPPDEDGVRAVRDPSSGLLSTELEQGVRGDRIAAAALMVFVFGGAVLVLLAILVRRAREHLLVWRAARVGEEILVDVAAEQADAIAYRVTERVSGDEGGYRTAARGVGFIGRLRKRGDEELPLIIGGPHGKRLLALRLPGSRHVVVVRKDFWPFVVEGRARDHAVSQLGELAR